MKRTRVYQLLQMDPRDDMLPARRAIYRGGLRLNQWAHWARAQGPGFFFFLRGPQLAVVK